MDPAACLDDVDYAFTVNDHDGIVEGLTAYADWRNTGGFEPPDGDRKWAMLRTRYGVMCGSAMASRIPDLR